MTKYGRRPEYTEKLVCVCVCVSSIPLLSEFLNAGSDDWTRKKRRGDVLRNEECVWFLFSSTTFFFYYPLLFFFFSLPWYTVYALDTLPPTGGGHMGSRKFVFVLSRGERDNFPDGGPRCLCIRQAVYTLSMLGTLRFMSSLIVLAAVWWSM